MLTIRSMRKGAGYAAKYLEQADYYADGEKKVRGEWFGNGAAMLGLSGEVDHDQFERVRLGLHPVTGERLRQRRSERTLYDFTFSSAKSISLLSTLGGDERIKEAHDHAVREAMEELERHAATRVRANGQDHDRTTGNLVAAAYCHRDSRWIDPNLHTHVAAANLTWDENERKWKALQAGEIYARATFIGEVYRNSMAFQLGAFGYEIEPREHGFEIKGVPQSLIDKFSQGSQAKEEAVRAFAAKHGRQPTKNEISVLMRNIRPDKMFHISTEEVRQRQFERLTAEDQRALAQVRERADRNRERPAPAHSAEQSLQHALDHVYERVSVAPDYVVLAEALKHGRGKVALKDLTNALRERERADEIIRAGNDIATRASLERERETIRLVNQGIGKHEPLGKASRDFQLSEKLTAEQRSVIQGVLDSRDFAVGIAGAAGTGKTETLKELRRGLQASGRLMVAVAPTMGAAEELKKKAGFQNASTIESLLQNKEAHVHLTGRALIVDEAGMVGGQAMHGLLSLAGRYGARVVLAGDWRQLQSVPASDAFRILQKESHLASFGLREVKRQQTREYREAIETLRENPAKGFEKLDKMGAVKECGLFDRAEAVANAYLKAKGSVLCVAPTHEELGRITEAVRNRLKERGELGKEAKLHRLEPLNFTEAQKRDVRNLTPGHVLVFHRGTKEARKHESYTVTAQEGESVTARNDRGNQIKLTQKQAACFGVFERREIGVAGGDWLKIEANLRDPVYQFTNGERVKVASVNKRGGILLEDGRTVPHQFRQFTHGFGVTIHASQGKSVDKIIISGDRFNRELFYVAASRGKKEITVFTGDKTKLRESIGISGERMSALELLRMKAREEARTRAPDRSRAAERPASVRDLIGLAMLHVWENIPSVLLAGAFGTDRDGRERGR